MCARLSCSSSALAVLLWLGCQVQMREEQQAAADMPTEVDGTKQQQRRTRARSMSMPRQVLAGGSKRGCMAFEPTREAVGSSGDGRTGLFPAAASLLNKACTQVAGAAGPGRTPTTTEPGEKEPRADAGTR